MADPTRIKTDLAATWTYTNPVLAAGEEGYETDTQRRKIGNGVTAWSSLAYQDDDLNKVLTADVTNITTTMAALTDLSATLPAAGRYTGVLTLFVTNALAADGMKVDFDGGAATATTFTGGITANAQGGTVGVGVTAALATDLTLTALADTALHVVVVSFFLQVNAAGTFIPRQAKVADAASAILTILKGSSLTLTAAN